MENVRWPSADESHGFRSFLNAFPAPNPALRRPNEFHDPLDYDERDSDDLPDLEPIEPGDSLWLCVNCHSADWRREGAAWTCMSCGCNRFRDAFLEDSRRVQPPPRPWHYERSWPRDYPDVRMPDDPRPMSEPNEDYENPAESEQLTNDPTVDPDDPVETPARLSRRQRRAARKKDALHADQLGRRKVSHDTSMQSTRRGGAPSPSSPGHSDGGPSSSKPSSKLSSKPSTGPHGQWRDEMLKKLVDQGTKEPWNIAMGPSPGLKYRGGTPPQPPPWTYAKDDLRAFSKWERKLDVWRLQIRAYLPPRESSLMLYLSLRGDAEEELEHCDLKKVDSDDGVDYIVEMLRAPLMTKTIYLKRKYLHEFETIQRHFGESIRDFTNRYHRTERSLLAVGINAQAMYDEESRGSRILDRMRLSLEAQRLVLVGCQQSLKYHEVVESALLQFPQHRPAPLVVYVKEFEGKGDRNHRPDQSKPHSANSGQGGGQSNQKGSKGDSKGKRPSAFTNTKRTYVAENPDNEDQPTEDHAEEQAADEDADQQAPDGDEADENQEDEGAPEGEDDELDSSLRDVVQCLTVTARRLQSLTLGRRFSGKKTIEQRKQESHCAVCGEKGHWQGDAACRQSSKPAAGKGGAKGDAKKPDKPSSAPAKRVLRVQQPNGSLKSVSFDEDDDGETHDGDDQHGPFGTYFTFMTNNPSININQVYGTNIQSFADFMVLDTACQRTCCSSTWFSFRKEKLERYNLKMHTSPNKEPFEFGHGPTQFSHQHALIPAGLDDTHHGLLLLGACVISTTNDIPLLGSSGLLSDKLQVVLDLPKRSAYLRSLQITLPICMVNGHLAFNISKFPEHVSKSPVWHDLTKLCGKFEGDRELMLPPQALKVCNTRPDSPSNASRSASTMVAELEPLRCSTFSSGKASMPGDDTGSEATNSTKALADLPRPSRDGQHDEVDGHVPTALPTSVNSTVREQARQFRQVPGLPKGVAVVRRTRSLGRSSAIAAATTAIACILNSVNLCGQEPKAPLDPGSLDFLNNFGASSPRANHGCYQATSNNQGEEEHGQTQEFWRWQAESSPQGGGRGGGNLRRVRQVDDRPMMKRPKTTWVTGHLRQVLKTYEMENQAYAQMPNHKDKMQFGPKIDLLEVFAGSANLTARAPRFKLSALEPIDIKINVDLTTPEGRAIVWRAVKKFRPLLVVVEWPCKEWSIFNENMNYSWRPGELEQLREQERPLVEFGADLMHYQHEHDRFYLGENPLRSRIWREEPVVSVTELPDNITTRCDAGAYGAETEDGWPIQKPHQWIGNSKEIMAELCRVITDEAKLYTKPVQGKDTEASGRYCDGLCDAILRGLKREAVARDPLRFRPPEKASVYYVKPTNDEQAWDSLLNTFEKRFENTHKKPYNLPTNDDLYNEICRLVPWDIERIQVAWLPVARRWPTDIPFTHRGAALRTASGKIILESEDLSSVVYPKQRYFETIRLGIFFFGHAPGGPQDDSQDASQDATTDGAEQRPQQETPSSKDLVSGMTTDIWFEDAPPEMTKELKKSLARLHANMGHPPKEELIRILAASNNLSSKVLAGLDALRCGSCLRLTLPKKPAVSSTSTMNASAFGDRLQADIVYIRTLSQNVPVLGIVDEFTNYIVATTLTDRHPATVLKTFLTMWYHPLGLPQHLTVDPDTAFLGNMEEWHARHGIEYEIIPAEEHWRIGKIERRNALLRTLVERLVDHHAVVSREALDEVIVAACHSLNSSTYSYGRSPFQAVFGRIPRPLGDLLSDDKALVISNNDNQIFRPELLRAEAVTTLMQISASQAVRRGLLRKTRPQQDLPRLQPGQTIAFWRWQGRSRQHKKGSWSLGRYLASDPDKKSSWIQVGKTTIRIGNNQIRLACGWEDWSPSEEDVKLLKDAEANLSQGLWDDSRGDPPGEDEAQMIDQEIFNFRPIQEPRLHSAQTELQDQSLPPTPRPETVQAPTDILPDISPDIPMNTLDLPAPTIQQARDQEQPTQQPSAAPAEHTFQQQLQLAMLRSQQQYNTQQHVTINIDSPTYQQYQPNFGPTMPTPRSRHRSRTPNASRDRRPTPLRQAEQRPALTDATTTTQVQPPSTQPDSVQQYNQPSSLPSQAAATATAVPQATTPDIQAAPNTPQPPERLPELPQKRPADALINYYMTDDGSLQPLIHWDGSEELSLPYAKSDRCHQAYLNSKQREIELSGIGEFTRPDHDSSDEDLQLSNERGMTRQEAKQLDREIPWRDIMKQDEATIQQYVESAISEYNGWMKWGGVRAIPEDEANRIRNSAKMRPRIMKSRAAYRDKNRGQPPLRPKTRVVVIGCADPDLRQLSRDSPAPTRLSEMIILCIATSGANGEFNMDGLRWTLWLSDAEKAFLQGFQDKSERNGPIFMEPPRDPIQQRAKAFAAALYEILGNCYGLSNAPRTWYIAVDAKLRKNGFIQHSLDRCFYMHFDASGQLNCALIVHVDDFMAVYSTSFPIAKLEAMFEWGSITKITENQPGVYRGKEITLKRHGGKLQYYITQKKFIEGTTAGKLPPGRLQQDSELSTAEMSDFRSAVGSLQWLSGQTRPDLAAASSLCQKGSKTEISDLNKVYECIKHARETPDFGIGFPSVPFNQNSVILIYSDASWANASNLTSQFGVLVTICPPQVTERTCNAFLVDWKSGRTQRVCRSTLAAEAYSADEGADRGSFVNYFITEIFHQIPAYKGVMKMNMKQAVDAKSLFDCLVAENPSTSEKRSLIAIRSVQQSLGRKDVHWVPTQIMQADGLTKLDPKLRSSLMQWCSAPWCQLREEAPTRKSTTEKTERAIVSTSNKDQCEDLTCKPVKRSRDVDTFIA